MKSHSINHSIRKNIWIGTTSAGKESFYRKREIFDWLWFLLDIHFSYSDKRKTVFSFDVPTHGDCDGYSFDFGTNLDIYVIDTLEYL